MTSELYSQPQQAQFQDSEVKHNRGKTAIPRGRLLMRLPQSQDSEQTINAPSSLLPSIVTGPLHS